MEAFCASVWCRIALHRVRCWHFFLLPFILLMCLDKNTKRPWKGPWGDQNVSAATWTLLACWNEACAIFTMSTSFFFLNTKTSWGWWEKYHYVWRCWVRGAQNVGHDRPVSHIGSVGRCHPSPCGTFLTFSNTVVATYHAVNHAS